MASFVNFASRNFTKAVAAAGGAFAAFNASKYIGESNEGACGSGRSAYAKFPAANDFPDLAKHNNCMATHLTEKVYKKLRDLVRFTNSLFKEIQQSFLIVKTKKLDPLISVYNHRIHL